MRKEFYDGEAQDALPWNAVARRPSQSLQMERAFSPQAPATIGF
jgi:hypothetical protein